MMMGRLEWWYRVLMNHVVRSPHPYLVPRMYLYVCIFLVGIIRTENSTGARPTPILITRRRKRVCSERREKSVSQQ